MRRAMKNGGEAQGNGCVLSTEKVDGNAIVQNRQKTVKKEQDIYKFFGKSP